MFYNAFFLTALVATTLASPFVPLHRRAPSLSVELSVGNGSTEVKAVMTNNGAESISVLRSTSLMDPRPVKKLRVFKNGLLSSPHSES
jgi:Deuterolysin metalloprotease (M35) family